MPEAEPLEALSGIRKAAILLIALGEQTSAEILRHLPDDEVQAVSREVARVSSVPMEQTVSVLEEFNQMSFAREYLTSGGVDYAKRMLMNAFGNENGARLMERLTKSMGNDLTNFDALQRADPLQLAKFVHNEHPQTIALVLAHLATSQAATLLSSLPADLRAEVSRRMARIDQISPEVVSKIAKIIGMKLKTLGEFSRQAYGGVRAVAEILNRLETSMSEEILSSMQDDPEVPDAIRKLMFVFDDFLRMDKETIKLLVGKVDRKTLTLALKGVGSDLRDHFTATMSQRAREMVTEDMDALGAVKIRDVQAAQQEIIGLARQLHANGLLDLKGSPANQYIQ